MNMKVLANSLPYPLKQGLKYAYCAIPLPIRYGKVFRDTYAFLQESQWWSKEQLEEYQLQQLSKLLQHAYENVPYYRRVFDERGLKPKDIPDFTDLQMLPYLTKEDVRTNFNDLIARNIPKEQMDYGTTGGSTAVPLGFYIEKKTHKIRMAFEWREWNWMGYNFGDKCVVLRGTVINRFENGKRAWWEYDSFNNYLILSSYDMTAENLFKYVDKIEEFQPKVTRAYPSSIDILARFIKQHSLKINKEGNIKAISTSSENLFEMQKEITEQTFACPIIDKYGNSEQANIAGMCVKPEGYHIFLEYGITEIIGKDNNPITKEGEIGEIIGTGFTNYAMPFFRYKTGDSAVWTNKGCGCGRDLPLLKKIEGRWLQERIITRQGSFIAITALNSHTNIFENVKQFQYFQEEKGKVILKIEIKLLDLRQERTIYKYGLVWNRTKLKGDPEGYKIVDLKENSAMKGIDSNRLYGADYNRKEIISAHSNGSHKYFISKTVLNADVVISVPKMKVHRKAGVTLNLKNMVGINGNKNYLAHYRIGPPEKGRDEFSRPYWVYGLDRRLKDLLLSTNWKIGKYPFALWSFVKGMLLKLAAQDDVFISGDWYGNDTVWRMAVDINKILLYADKEGVMKEDPQRRYFSVIDGIIAGEKEGPLGPSPKYCELLIAGCDPVLTDFIATKAMGFDYHKIPLLKNAFEIKKYALSGYNMDDAIIKSNVPENELIFRFEPSDGWKEHIEL